MSRLVPAPPRNVASSRAMSVGVWPPSVSVRSSIGTLRSGALLRAQRCLTSALRALILDKSLRRVHVGKTLVPRRELLPARRSHAEPLCDHRHDRVGFHLPDAGERKQPLLEVGSVRRIVPDRRRVAVVLARDRSAELLRAAC